MKNPLDVALDALLRAIQGTRASASASDPAVQDAVAPRTTNVPFQNGRAAVFDT